MLYTKMIALSFAGVLIAGCGGSGTQKDGAESPPRSSVASSSRSSSSRSSASSVSSSSMTLSSSSSSSQSDINSSTASSEASSSLAVANNAPTLTLLGASSLTLRFKQSFIDPGTHASDPEDGDITAQVVVSGTVNTELAGRYTLTYTVTDSGNLTDATTRQVRVQENQAPTLTLRGAATMSVAEGATFNDPGATATDVEDGNLSSAITVDLGGLTTSTPGRYTVSYRVQDAEGLVASRTRIVDVYAAVSDRSHSMGMGLNGINDWSTQMPFVDLMKQSRGWYDWSNRTELPFDVDANDWVLSLQSGQTAGTVFLTLESNAWSALPFTRAHVFYEGQGTIRYTVAARKLDDESVPGHDVISLNWGNAFLNITAINSADPLRNIRIIPEPFLAAYEAGETFNPVWIERIKQFRAVRFMDWMSTNNSKLSRWADRPQRAHRSWRTVPLEVMVELANTLGADPWFNIPHLADTNYMQEFAAQVKAELNPKLTVYVEHSNEVWNWQFGQAQYANTTGRARWGNVGNAYMQWHGMRTAQVCDAFKQGAFAGNTQRVKCVLGVQTVYHGLQKGAMECPLWVAEGNAPCHQHGLDYIAITSYFAGSLNAPTTIDTTEDHQWEAIIRGWIAEGTPGLEKAMNYLLTGEGFGAIGAPSMQHGVRQFLLDELAYWVPYANEHNMKIVAYEGGQHITANGGELQNDTDLINFHIAINNHPRMYNVYNELFNAWKDGGGELHMHFVDIGPHNKYGSWGALKSYTQTSSPRWNAIQNFNKTVACWWNNCDAP